MGDISSPTMADYAFAAASDNQRNQQTLEAKVKVLEGKVAQLEAKVNKLTNT